MIDMVINKKELDDFLRSLDTSGKRATGSSIRWIRRLTVFTEKRMRMYARSKTKRASGNLASSIVSKYKINSGTIGSEVGPTVPYQFAAEYGIKKNFRISGKPVMVVDGENWKKARRGSSKVRMGKRDIYFFRSVKRGRYKGKMYVGKSYADLMNFYEANKDNIVSSIGESLVFGVS